MVQGCQINSVSMLSIQLQLSSVLLEKTKPGQYFSKSLSVPDEEHLRIFLPYANLFSKCRSLALWEESHAITHPGDEIVYLELALAINWENYKLPENPLVTLDAEKAAAGAEKHVLLQQSVV